MKTVRVSPQPVNKINPISMEHNNRSQFRDERETNYFPGCRKDANCNCKMCLESITATLDLMPMSVQRSSLTKLSACKPTVEITPLSIDPTLLSTPTSKIPPVVETASSKTVLRSTATTRNFKKVELKKGKIGMKLKVFKWVLLLGLIIGFEFGFSWGVPRVLQPELSGEMVRDVVNNSSSFEKLNVRLISIRKELIGFVAGKVCCCNLDNSTWRINQDGLMLISYCILYQSAAEEVVIRGWPLETAGLFTAEFSSRSFTLLSGRITEWPEGQMSSVIREVSSTWMIRKWSASVMRFEPNTWLIEYRRNCLLENHNGLVLAVEFIFFRISKLVQIVKRKFWYLSELRYYTSSTSKATGFSVPT
ncbi:uncharacterized protein LOC130825247 [Amaranthus tricolor]|uniref:uncharacterized protein LOC130825247 n=1 Tax=Amaranthus tricolor TaxID=29722 RepID=UPI00258FF106|nr:uncharacterized protein LOC130825247 [Amaranthus tricolor]XP_057546359.1 uncharacterized protein LOC130825247 [Amaranthus tricolor]